MFYMKTKEFVTLNYKGNIKIEEKDVYLYNYYNISNNNYWYEGAIKKELDLKLDFSQDDLQKIATHFSHIFECNDLCIESNGICYSIETVNSYKQSFVFIDTDILEKLINTNIKLKLDFSFNNGFVLVELLEDNY